MVWQSRTSGRKSAHQSWFDELSDFDIFADKTQIVGIRILRVKMVRVRNQHATYRLCWGHKDRVSSQGRVWVQGWIINHASNCMFIILKNIFHGENFEPRIGCPLSIYPWTSHVDASLWTGHFIGRTARAMNVVKWSDWYCSTIPIDTSRIIEINHFQAWAICHCF